MKKVLAFRTVGVLEGFFSWVLFLVLFGFIHEFVWLRMVVFKGLVHLGKGLYALREKLFL